MDGEGVGVEGLEAALTVVSCLCSPLADHQAER